MADHPIVQFKRDVELVRHQLGHRDLRSTLNYAQASDQDVAEAMRMLPPF